MSNNASQVTGKISISLPNNTDGTGSVERYAERMARKASVLIEKDEHGFYAWCPELKGCQSHGNTLEEAVLRSKGSYRIYGKAGRTVTVPFHSGASLHQSRSKCSKSLRMLVKKALTKDGCRGTPQALTIHTDVETLW